MVKKTCSKCRQLLSLINFYKNKGCKGGYHYYCKKCLLRHMKEHWPERREVALITIKKYQQTVVGKAVKKKAMKKYRNTFKGWLRRRWECIQQRCENPKNPAYKNYGGRGILNQFQSYNAFYGYIVFTLGYNSKDKFIGLQLDRINNDGNYEPGNIRLVTSKVNNNNRRNSKKESF